ncbi:hypothetical protein HWV62_33169 [Athelia sp. TMB]|nr:hypothetical protein HWV62_34499 [Athelia sp. TMB]KAF7981559.1 hypothetical protein HWV62_33169 [Athelia sp. TMB]
MEHIDPESLHALPSRIAYLKTFLDFGPQDAAVLHSVQPLLSPMIPDILDAVYEKLLCFDITAASFTSRNSDYHGPVTQSVRELTIDSPQIQWRKDFMRGYLSKLLEADYDDEKTWEYMEKVGIMHTGKPGFAHREAHKELRVEYVHMSLLLGYLLDLILTSVLDTDLDTPTQTLVLRAFNKLFWIQNDLFSKHYMK